MHCLIEPLSSYHLLPPLPIPMRSTSSALVPEQQFSRFSWRSVIGIWMIIINVINVFPFRSYTSGFSSSLLYVPLETGLRLVRWIDISSRASWLCVIGLQMDVLYLHSALWSVCHHHTLVCRLHRVSCRPTHRWGLERSATVSLRFWIPS